MSQSLDEAARQLTETSILFEQGRGDIRSPEQRHSLSGTMDILHRIDEAGPPVRRNTDDPDHRTNRHRRRAAQNRSLERGLRPLGPRRHSP